MTDTAITTKIHIHYDEALPKFSDLSWLVQSEVRERIAFCMATVAWFVPPMNTTFGDGDYVPEEVHISVDKQMAYVNNGIDYEGGEVGYLPVVESGLSTELWGITVHYFDPGDGSSGNVIYRTQYGELAHYL